MKLKTLTFVSPEPIKLGVEDSGATMVIVSGEPEVAHADQSMVIHITSDDETLMHSMMRELEGKRVRVVLEVF